MEGVEFGLYVQIVTTKPANVQVSADLLGVVDEFLMRERGEKLDLQSKADVVSYVIRELLMKERLL